MAEDDARVVGVVLDEDGVLSKLVVEQEDHSTSELEIPTGPAGADGADGVVQTVAAGDGVAVDDTDPANPVVSVGVQTTDLVFDDDAVGVVLESADGTQYRLKVSDGGVLSTEEVV